MLVVASLWSVCTASHAQDRAECERIVHLVAEAVGAGADLLDDRLWESLRPALAGRRETTLTGADAEARRVRSAKVKRLKIGDREFRRVPTVFNDMSHLNRSLKRGLDGLIGFPILSGQKTVLSYRSGRLIFLP